LDTAIIIEIGVNNERPSVERGREFEAVWGWRAESNLKIKN
jgi:hypothetical protein